MTDVNQFTGNKLRKALQYRRAGIPESFWFKDYPDIAAVDSAIQQIEKGKWLAVFSRDVVAQLHFIAEIMKNKPELNPKFIDFSSFILRMVGRYSKYELLSDYDGGLVGMGGIRYSTYYRGHTGDLLTYLGRAFGKFNASIILGFQKVDESKMRSTYGQEMMDFIENSKFVYFNV